MSADLRTMIVNLRCNRGWSAEHIANFVRTPHRPVTTEMVSEVLRVELGAPQ